MGKYGQAAVYAVELVAKDCNLLPRDAWLQAVQLVFPDHESSRAKGCPKAAFLALCETGSIRHIPAGNYTTSISNKADVLRGFVALRDNPSLCSDQARLWSIAVEGRSKVHNSQMDVLTALFESGLLT